MKNPTNLKLILSVSLWLGLMASCTNQSENNNLISDSQGPGLLGQSFPGEKAELFAPGIASTGIASRDVSISPDGKEVCFALSSHDFSYASIFLSRKTADGWTKPEIFPFATDSRYIYFEPTFSPDGERIYFLSNRPANGDGEPVSEDIWYSERTADGWSAPKNAGSGVNTQSNEFFASLTNDGTLYFTRADETDGRQYIYRARPQADTFATAERLPKQVNCGTTQFNAFVAPDESYVIVPAFGREDSFGGADYYITFRNANDQWSEPQNMGPEVNSAARAEWSPYVSPDGKYFFFMTNKIPDGERQQEMSYDFFNALQTNPYNGTSNTYWMKADFIESLRENAKFE
jgi:hypothetical protein